MINCEVCGKVIVGNPLTVKSCESYFDGELEFNEHVFCSKECEVLSLVIDPFHQHLGGLSSIVNHIIKLHGFKVSTVEAALNSEMGKKLRGF